MKSRKRLGAAILLSLCLSLGLCTTAFADTDGTEPKITQQPDQLVLQLGTRWAGVEFELRTDAGLFPVPIVVDSTGVLTMDLGGSKTYTLSCISSSVPIPDPVPEQQQGSQAPSNTQQPPSDAAPPAANSQQEQPAQAPDSGIPTGPLVIFLVGLACGVGGLVALYLSKRRRQAAYDDWDEDEYEE